MLKKICFVLIFAFLFLFWSDVSISQNMKEGLWEITMTMEVPEVPMKMPPHTWTQCLTKKDYIPKVDKEDKDCKVIKSEAKGNVFTWLIECKDQDGTSTGYGRTVYKGDTFEGIIKVKFEDAMEITQNLTGKWIGQCK